MSTNLGKSEDSLQEVGSCFPSCGSPGWNYGGKSHLVCLVTRHLYYKSFWLCIIVALKGGGHKIQLLDDKEQMLSVVIIWYTRQST